MSNPDGSPHQPQPGLALRVDELRTSLRFVPANLLAERTGSTYHALDSGRGEFRLSLFDSPLVVLFPGLVAYQTNGEPFPHHIQAANANNVGMFSGSI